LVQGKRVHFVNPNTGSPNFAFPEVLLARAEKGSAPPKEKKEKAPKQSQTAKAEEILEKSTKKTPKGELEIIGYLVPDLTPDQVANEIYISCPPVFGAEKGLYKKSRVFPTTAEAKEALFKLYGRRQ
jgi:hypothetical protein